jgi:hypothetical protein
VVGVGKHLFDDWSDEMPMRLAESSTLGNGVLSLIYEPARIEEQRGAVAS